MTECVTLLSVFIKTYFAKNFILNETPSPDSAMPTTAARKWNFLHFDVVFARYCYEWIALCPYSAFQATRY